MRKTSFIAWCAWALMLAGPRQAAAEPSAHALGAGHLGIGVGATTGLNYHYSLAGALEASAGIGIVDGFDVGLRLARPTSLDDRLTFSSLAPTVEAKIRLAGDRDGVAFAIGPAFSLLRYSADIYMMCTEPFHDWCQPRMEVRTTRLELPLTMSTGGSSVSHLYLTGRLIADYVQPTSSFSGAEVYSSTLLRFGVILGFFFPVGPVSIAPELRAVLGRVGVSGKQLGDGNHGFNSVELALGVYYRL